VLKKIIDLPFELYDTFVIEERFGFNKTTQATFWADQVKGLLLLAVIGGIFGAIVIAFFQYLGAPAWLWGWIAAAVLSLLLTYLAPTVIMPLFNKFEPLKEGELRKRIMEYAQKVDFPLAEVQVMDGSKRSSKSNAFFTGFGKNRKVALYDTLIENHTEPELVGVFAHEVGHFKKKHIPQMMAFSIINMGVMFFLAGLFINNQGLHDAFRMEQTSVYASLLFFGLLYTPVSRILGTLAAIWSRKNEFEADEFAAKTTGSAQPLIDALKKLSKDNLSNLTPHPFYVFLNYSHPPMLKRLRELEAKDPQATAAPETRASSS
jgi:STE24 endopeptidase